MVLATELVVVIFIVAIIGLQLGKKILSFHNGLDIFGLNFFKQKGMFVIFIDFLHILFYTFGSV